MGLIVSLTHLLTRPKSFCAFRENATSRGAVIWPMHAPGCRVQNSTHPTGGCVTLETRMCVGWLGPARAGSTSMALTASTANNAALDFRLTTLETTVQTLARRDSDASTVIREIAACRLSHS